MGRRGDPRHKPCTWFTRRCSGKGRGDACVARTRGPDTRFRYTPPRAPARALSTFVSLSAVGFPCGNDPLEAGANRFSRCSPRPAASTRRRHMWASGATRPDWQDRGPVVRTPVSDALRLARPREHCPHLFLYPQWVSRAEKTLQRLARSVSRGARRDPQRRQGGAKCGCQALYGLTGKTGAHLERKPRFRLPPPHPRT